MCGCPRKDAPITGDTPGTMIVKPDSEGLLLTWIDEKGDFQVVQKPSDVPLVGRDVVKVVDPSREEGTHSDKVFVVGDFDVDRESAHKVILIGFHGSLFLPGVDVQALAKGIDQGVDCQGVPEIVQPGPARTTLRSEVAIGEHATECGVDGVEG